MTTTVVVGRFTVTTDDKGHARITCRGCGATTMLSPDARGAMAAPLVLAAGVEVDALGDDARRGLVWLTGRLGQQPGALGDVLALVDAIRDAEREAAEGRS